MAQPAPVRVVLSGRAPTHKLCIAVAAGALAFAGVMVPSKTASAQAWLGDRQYTEGPGIQSGDFEFHPGIAMQGGYNSNWFMRSDKSGYINSGPQGAAEMQISPSISLATLGVQRSEGRMGLESRPITFRATASGTYNEFFGQLQPEQRNGSIDAAANLGILPGRAVGAGLSVNYDRIIQPTSLTTANPDMSYTRDTLGAKAELVLQPGGGTLDWHFGGTVNGTLFEDSGGLGYDNLSFGAFTIGRWKFRPKTALVYDANFGFTSYTDPTGGLGQITALHSSDPVRTHLGINGLLTPRVGFSLLAGYGGSFFSPGSSPDVKQYDSVIGQAELRFYLTEPPGGGNPGAVSLSQSTLAIGYNRDFETSYLADFDGIDRGYLKFAYFFAGRALVTLDGGVGAVEYPELDDIAGSGRSHTPFTDCRIDGTLYGEYRFTNYFALTATLKYATNLSNAVLDLTPPLPANQTPTQNYSMEWQQYQAFLGVRLFL